MNCSDSHNDNKIVQIDDFKWKNKLVLRLIKLKHSCELMARFKKAEKNPRQTSEVWCQLANEIRPDLSSKLVKIKYNGLLSNLENSGFIKKI